MRWPYDKRADPVHAWGTIAAGIALAGVIYAARALYPSSVAKSWGWPTNWMIIPVIVTGVGLILLALPVRRSRGKAVPHRWISRFDRDYRAFVLAGLRFIDQKGLATVGPFTPELDAVYVDVSLVRRPPHLVNEGLLPDLPPDVTERRALSEFLDHPDSVVLAVIGAPGSGKTTLLRHTARQVCQRRRSQKRHLPILLYLRDHAAAIIADHNVALTALLRDTLGELRSAEPDGWFEQRLRDGECVVFLDGLDEVARPEDRRKVASWAAQQIRQYSGNDYVITSRPQGYRDAKIDGADVLQVRGFSTEQVSRFVHSWYLAMERHSTGAADEDITIRASREAGDLLQRLDSAPALYDLTVNPLLLTMIANVHRWHGALPRGRAHLYAEIMQVMLSRRQEAKDLPVELAGDKKEALLRGLAYAMMDRRLSDLPYDKVLAEIGPVLRRLPRHVTAEGFLADVESNGLLIERESGLYCFAHHTFQEYLAAEYIRDKGLVDVLAKAVDDPWWRETTLLYTARADADPIVGACLNSGTITALALAFDCADQGSEFAEDLRDRLEGLLAEVSNPATSQERRHLITGVRLTRHLHQQVRISDRSRICTRPISASLYQLFRDDTHTPAPDSPPSATAGTEPVTGIRASDAAAFVRWVNDLIGGETAYHLPSRAALDDPTAQRLITSTATHPSCSIWIGPGPAATELWVLPGTRHPHQIDAETLITQLDSDITRSAQTLIRVLLMRSASAVDLLSSYFALWHPADDVNALLHTQGVIPGLVSVYGQILDLHLRPAVHDVAVAFALSRSWDFARDLDRVIDRVRELARADIDRNLTRARDRALVLDRALTLAHVRAQGHARALARALDRILDLDRARDLARDRALERDLDHALERDLAGGRYLARDQELDLALARDQELDLALDLDLGHALERDLPVGRDLARDVPFADGRYLARGRSVAYVLDLNVARARARARDRALDPNYVRALDLEMQCSQFMGSALSRAGTEVLRPQVPQVPVDALLAEFSGAFTHATGIAGIRYLVSPDTLTQRLTDAVQALQATQKPYSKTGEPSWAATVAHRLQEIASPVFNRQEQLTRDATTSIRLAALCLAAEADGLDQRELGKGFREIAAGVTLLERRANGDDPATETIILASE